MYSYDVGIEVDVVGEIVCGDTRWCRCDKTLSGKGWSIFFFFLVIIMLSFL